MAITTRLQIVLLDEGQRQKETTINEAFTTIDANLNTDMGEFTVGQLPAASSNPNAMAIATNASGGRTLVRSDGTNWKVIAVEGATVTV